MLNYVNHRAIFEGMNAHLWSPNSGRILWMTQPAWPSTMWQILSSDYDTQASFYGVMKACEPLHVQLDLASYDVELVNTTNTALSNATITADVFSLDNKLLLHREAKQNSSADAVVNAFHLDLTPFFANGVVLVKLELKSVSGETLSRNFYWLGANSTAYRDLNTLPAATIVATAVSGKDAGHARIHVQLKNTGSTVAIENKLTLLNAVDGTRILPAYLSDNYVSLMPGESREIDIEYPALAEAKPELSLRGWNLTPQTIAVTQK